MNLQIDPVNGVIFGIAVLVGWLVYRRNHGGAQAGPTLAGQQPAGDLLGAVTAAAAVILALSFLFGLGDGKTDTGREPHPTPTVTVTVPPPTAPAATPSPSPAGTPSA
ncbi:hypothetical protein OIE69_44495 (plasmid) [Actinacidiphila glaucinigra]|uniref:hypothetical protein n=1 Tax=Actinacidiphila glaucinigra TaxID=235986 RepID=UPI002DD8438A|nr:hypothetical protein [Actinacidiphila glaucinigra]WSD65747.1 hypothetical protein OIE69_43355 [Actinacidiphila glaucinigra]WSD65965.1 hypothetical protein OIE69_44495 [Actinacidiphila glaucinigra]